VLLLLLLPVLSGGLGTREGGSLGTGEGAFYAGPKKPENRRLKCIRNWFCAIKSITTYVNVRLRANVRVHVHAHSKD